MADWTRLTVTDLTRDRAAAIATWRYRDRWSIYDSDGELDPADGYRAVVAADGALVGFCCLGADARVPGLDAAEGVVDVGVGMNPDYIHSGHGRAFASAVLDWARREAEPGARLRAVVQVWNMPSLRLTRSLGFVEEGRHDAVQDDAVVHYVLMVTPD